MSATIAQLDTDITNIKDTPSNEVEYNGGISLQAVIKDLRDLLFARGIPYCVDVTALGGLSGLESPMVYVEGVGLFYWYQEGSGEVQINAINGGYWCFFRPALATTDLTNVSTTAPTADGQIMRWDNTQQKFIPAMPTVPFNAVTGTAKVVKSTPDNVIVTGYQSQGGLTVDTAHHIAIDINGTTYKLAIKI